jgi:hypothetical protein
MLPHSLLLRMYNFVEIQFIKINFRHFKKTEGSIIHTIFLKKTIWHFKVWNYIGTKILVFRNGCTKYKFCPFKARDLNYSR